MTLPPEQRGQPELCALPGRCELPLVHTEMPGATAPGSREHMGAPREEVQPGSSPQRVHKQQNTEAEQESEGQEGRQEMGPEVVGAGCYC